MYGANLAGSTGKDSSDGTADRRGPGQRRGGGRRGGDQGQRHAEFHGRRDRRLAGGAGHRRFLGALVWALQAARPRHREGGARGAVRLVKVDIDKNQELAAQMRIQSIPAVYAFFQGRPVDGFVGALPESQVKAFVARLMKSAGAAEPGPSPIDQALEQAEAALEDGDHGTASAIFGQVLQHEAGNLPAIAGLTRAHLAAGDLEGAKKALARAPADKAGDKLIAAARAAV